MKKRWRKKISRKKMENEEEKKTEKNVELRGVEEEEE
jgi:hypothetical protein